MIYYAGIGSRDTPPEICRLMTRIAKRLSEKGWTLRSGGAKGADSAFEVGSTLSEIYLPYDGFEKKRQHHTECYDAESFSNYQEARSIAAEFHPAWDRCSEWARKMHTRNVYQVLGVDLNTPSSCIICWTKDGGFNGGTAQSMRIAQARGIPIFNLYFDDSVGKLAEFVGKTED